VAFEERYIEDNMAVPETTRMSGKTKTVYK
jgi:hypothetical protein